jgi:hypothetical protein
MVRRDWRKHRISPSPDGGIAPESRPSRSGPQLVDAAALGAELRPAVIADRKAAPEA